MDNGTDEKRAFRWEVVRGMVKIMGNILKIVFMVTPIMFGRIYAGWPIWLNTIMFIVMFFVPNFGFIVECAAWIFALIAVITAPFTLVSLLFYILLLVYAFSVVAALQDLRDRRI